MHETELHDLSDDSDYAAASQYAGSTSMMRIDSGKSVASESGPMEVVYLKDNVAIHPTQYASERITGRLLLFKQGPSLFLSWIPYKPSTDAGADSLWQGSSSISPEKDRNLYTVKSLPLSDVHSIRRHTPALGWQYVIVVLASGLAYPPFYFYSGGVREFLATLKQHVFIVRSVDDANVFLVNDFQDPLQRTLSSLELPRASLHKPSNSFSSLDDSEIVNGANYGGTSSSVSEYTRRPKKSHDPARDISIQVLEKFSLVTKFARETTSHLFRENHGDFLNAHDKKHEIEYVSLNPAISPVDDEKKTTNAVQVDADPLEFEKLPLIWGKQRKDPLSLQEWESFFDFEGRIIDSKALKERIFYGGVEHNLRKEVWKFLLGYNECDSTYAEREYLASEKKSEYEMLKSQWQSISAAQAKRFSKFRERKGLIDKDVVRTDRSVAYFEGDDNPNVMVLRDILLTYSFYNFDLGYCQGMSDLLSPILYVMKDESESFWCFTALMERLGPNFNRDQSGMHSQLFALSKLVELLDSPLHNYFNKKDCLNYFFCFRWILIQFKREFEYEQILQLWEVLWTHYLSEHLHLYMCVAILKRHRNKIMGEQMDFDTLLKFINELSGSIDLDWTIREAEALCACGGENGAACIPPGTPPSLPIETDMGLYPQEDEVL
ncbi:TBC1 domain family member 15-like isoform X1 [Zingiber officinale]|uniref:TBC1 domain family member 15-like isoform X1 n=2 Tax=Zingiber officinale TaxID=94328 RepID=UPI001C4AE0BA|nr:TBC1 domain family member 15-like isoform X1 [Zingiber officinale]